MDEQTPALATDLNLPGWRWVCTLPLAHTLVGRAIHCGFNPERFSKLVL